MPRCSPSSTRGSRSTAVDGRVDLPLYTARFPKKEPPMNARDPLLPVQPDEAAALAAHAERIWDEQIVPALTKYIAIPAKSPMFDAEWQQHGYIEQVVRDAASWVESRRIAGLTLE